MAKSDEFDGQVPHSGGRKLILFKCTHAHPHTYNIHKADKYIAYTLKFNK